jgi:hypothetical protein
VAQVLLVRKDLKDHKGPVEPREALGQEVSLESREHLELLVRLVLQACLEILVHWDRLDHQDHWVRLALLEPQDLRVLVDQRDLSVAQE